ncbi:hypothetical protein VTK26DRAFT_6165 [Humicola hyalothermophila]
MALAGGILLSKAPKTWIDVSPFSQKLLPSSHARSLNPQNKKIRSFTLAAAATTLASFALAQNGTPATATAPEPATSSGNTVQLLIPNSIDDRGHYAVSIVSACKDHTVYAIQCTSASPGFPRVPSEACGRYTGSDFHLHQVTITGGAEKTAGATDVCKPNAAAAATGPNAIRVGAAPLAVGLLGAFTLRLSPVLAFGVHAKSWAS